MRTPKLHPLRLAAGWHTAPSDGPRLILSVCVLAILAGAATSLPACSDTTTGDAAAGPWPLYRLGADAGLYTHPYPSDLLRAIRSSDAIGDFPNPLSDKALDGFRTLAVAAATGGASLTAGLAIAFAAPVDTSGWPRGDDAELDPAAALQLIELDVDGVPSGRRMRFDWRWYPDARPYGSLNLLRVVPAVGHPLRAAARYAFVIRSGFGVERSPQIAQLFAGRYVDRDQPGLDAAQAAFTAAINDLAALGLAADDLAFVQVLTTADPAAALARDVADVTARYPESRFENLTTTRTQPEFCLVEGTVRLPQFQAGSPPFYPDGGNWVRDADGRLLQQSMLDVPVAIVIPKGTMPADGWPWLQYIHGTAGFSTQVIDRGPSPAPPDQEPAYALGESTTQNRGPGWVLAQRGIAAVGAALPLNPQRAPDALGWGFYNFFNPKALVGNFLQGVVEQALLLRAVTALTLDPELCPGSDASAASDGRIRFASTRLAAMGQSLGAIELGLWAPTEPLLGAVIPSGAGGLYSVMVTTSTIIPGELAVRWFAHPGDRDVIDQLHPLMLLVQQAVEPVDPVASAERVLRQPLTGVGAKHIYTPAGYIDGFFWPDSIRALMGPLGVAMVGPAIHPSLPRTMAEWDRPSATYPVSANVTGSDGKLYTAVVPQYREDGILDGHHVSYQLDGPKHQYSCFLRTFFDTDLPVVPAPGAITAPCE